MPKEGRLDLVVHYGIHPLTLIQSSNHLTLIFFLQMAHFLNDYFKLQGHTTITKKKMGEMQDQLLEAELAKSFTEVKVNRLKWAIQELKENSLHRV